MDRNKLIPVIVCLIVMAGCGACMFYLREYMIWFIVLAAFVGYRLFWYLDARVIRFFNRGKNDELSYNLSVMARDYKTPAKPGHCGEGWCVSGTRCTCICHVCWNREVMKSSANNHSFWEQN